MRKINWREWRAALWNQKTLTLSRIIFILALLLLLARLGIALFEYSRLARAALTFPFPLDYGEGPILDQTLRLSQFKNVYRNNFASPPYTVSNYPPLFQLIQVPLAWIVGPAFWYGRLISILSAVSAAALIGLLLHTLTRDRIAAAIGALTLLAFPYLLPGSVLNRVDTLALALSLGGLYVTVRWPGHRRGPWVAGLLFTAAVFTHFRYAVAAPLTALVWLWHLSQRRQAVHLAAIVIGGCLGLFLGMNLSTGGGFYLNTVRANLTSFSWYAVAGHWFNLYLNAGFLVIDDRVVGFDPHLDVPVVVVKGHDPLDVVLEPLAHQCAAEDEELALPRRERLLDLAVAQAAVAVDQDLVDRDPASLVDREHDPDVAVGELVDGRRDRDLVVALFLVMVLQLLAGTLYVHGVVDAAELEVEAVDGEQHAQREHVLALPRVVDDGEAELLHRHSDDPILGRGQLGYRRLVRAADVRVS